MTRIFCVYFDNRPIWSSDCVVPIQAGRARTGLDLRMMADDTGDNISAENVRYGEMTAWYWVWKNYLPAHPELTHVGFSHYRRFLDFAGFCRDGRTRRTTYRRFRRMFEAHFREEEIRKVVGDADLVMRRASDSGAATMREDYLVAHPQNIADFDRFVSLLRERHPDAAATIDAALDSPMLAMELQFVMTRRLFSEFMDWAFSLCREFERRWEWSGPAEGPKARAPAFLVERMFMVWLALRRRDPGFKVKELPIVKLTARPWWYHVLRPALYVLPKSVGERLYDRFK